MHQCLINLICFQVHNLNVLGLFPIKANDMLWTVAFGAHLYAYINLVILIVSVAEAIVEQQICTRILSIEEHDLLTLLDGLS